MPMDIVLFGETVMMNINTLTELFVKSNLVFYITFKIQLEVLNIKSNNTCKKVIKKFIYF